MFLGGGREGFVLNLIGVAIISTVAMFLVSKASKGVDPELVPPTEPEVAANEVQ